MQVVKGPGWGRACGEAGGRAGDGWTGAEGPQEEGSLGERAEAPVLTRKAALLRQLMLSGLGSRGVCPALPCLTSALLCTSGRSVLGQHPVQLQRPRFRGRTELPGVPHPVTGSGRESSCSGPSSSASGSHSGRGPPSPPINTSALFRAQASLCLLLFPGQTRELPADSGMLVAHPPTAEADAAPGSAGSDQGDLLQACPRRDCVGLTTTTPLVTLILS